MKFSNRYQAFQCMLLTKIQFELQNQFGHNIQSCSPEPVQSRGQHINRRRLRNGLSLLLLLGIALVSACGGPGSKKSANPEAEDPKGLIRFKPYTGIDYYEVKRAFDTGISYDSMGFVQVPEWHIKFAAHDSVLIYSPVADSLLGYKMYHDHEDYFHFARESWRVVQLHADSIILQLLSLKGLKVDKFKSNVYMKFYSEKFINEHMGNPDQSLNEKIAQLRLPTQQDSAFVYAMIARANRNPNNPDSAFASRNFAELKSKHPQLSIRKKKLKEPELTGATPSYEYLYPEYFIAVDGAYKDFGHDFSVVVDSLGNMHLGKVYVMEDFVEARTKVVQGIIDTYLKYWLEVKPAHTLGKTHASTVYIYMKGTKNQGD